MGDVVPDNHLLERLTLSEEFGELTPRSRPWQYFKQLDASDQSHTFL